MISFQKKRNLNEKNIVISQPETNQMKVGGFTRQLVY